MIHTLKTWPEYYLYVASGEKTFEIRKNDRDYKHWDILILREFDPKTNKYSGRWVVRRVTYITDFGMQPGYICMAIDSYIARTTAEKLAVQCSEEAFSAPVYRGMCEHGHEKGQRGCALCEELV